MTGGVDRPAPIEGCDAGHCRSWSRTAATTPLAEELADDCGDHRAVYLRFGAMILTWIAAGPRCRTPDS